MRLGALSLVALAACAVGSADGIADGTTEERAGESPPSIALPEGSGFDASGGVDASAGASSSGGPSGSSGSSSGGASSGASGSGSSSGGSSSGSSGSTSSSSGGTAGGACGVCDRNWTCNGFTDFWATQGGRCVNQRTTTALRCDGKFDQGGSVGVGTWTGDATKITLVYPMLGGGTKKHECLP